MHSESAVLRTVNQVPAMISYWDTDQRCVFANEAFRAVFGHGPEAMKGIHLAAQLGPLYEGSLPFIRGVLAGERQEFERELALPNGRTMSALVTYTPDLAHGAVVGFIAHVADVTRLRQREAALRRSSDLLERTGELARVGGTELDLRTGESFWSPEMFRMLEVSPPVTPPSDRWIDFFAPESVPTFVAARNALRAGSPAWDFEAVMVTSTGRRIWVRNQSSAVIENGAVVKLVTSIQDITERKRVEAENARLAADLQQAQKMESIGRIAGGVAHDFNNMLSVILGHTELAMRELAESHPVHADLAAVKSAAEESALLARQLLAFSRKDAVAATVLNLNETVANSLKMLRMLIGENIDVAWRPSADLWPVLLDRLQLGQILTNLCSNARDSIANKGSIVMETANVALEAGDGRFPSAGEFVRLSVRDNGAGMDAETLKRIFEPFYTTKEPGAGTGIGLDLVHGIVEKAGGFIKVESDVGRGTTFAIFLPRYRGSSLPVAAAPRAPAGPRGSETILMVEDEQAILKIASLVLEAQGYTVIAAETPSEAIRLANAHVGGIALLLTDVVLPEMDGAQLARMLTALQPALRSLFMTGYPAEVIERQGLQLGGVHLIRKPFSIGDLTTKVREVLDAKSAP